jgi:hypothetical protein
MTGRHHSVVKGVVTLEGQSHDLLIVSLKYCDCKPKG